MRRDEGYTIVEVMLFVAISGLLMMVVMSGFRSSIQTNRQTDTTRSFEGFIEAEYASVRAGSVKQAVDADGKVVCVTGNAATYPGASDDCVVLGKLLRINTATSQTQSYNVVANVKPNDAACGTTPTLTGVEAIRRYCPRVLDTAQPVDVVTPEWSARLSKAGFLNSNGSGYRDVNTIAFLRDPTSELVYVMPFNEPTAPVGQYDFRTRLDTAYANTRGVLCLTHDTFPATVSHVLFTGGEGVGSIETGSDNSGLEVALRC